jgi:predicted 3-demethylubiquinone-9 3-methyltransferase (glyoxalase superfamily)
LKFRAMFPDWISLVFGTGTPATNAEISARLKSITASWFGDQYGLSWQANLSAQP